MVGISYTRKQIRTRVERDIRDSTTIQTEADINRIISDVHKDMVERSECKRNTVIISLPDSSSDGALEFDLNESNRRYGTTPTLTRVDYDGYNFYTLLNCDKIVKIERWVTEDDGTWTQLSPVDQEDIARMHLLNGDYTYPYYYEMARNRNTFRMLQNPSSGAYEMKLRIKYIESVRDLVSDDDAPNDTSDPTMTTGAGLDDMNVLTGGTVRGQYEFIVFDDAADPETFKWRVDGGDWSSETNMETTAVTIENGITVSWDAVTGHTDDDVWTAYMDDPDTGDVPSEYRQGLLDGTLSRLFMLRGDVRAGAYKQSFEAEVQRCTGDVNIDTNDAPTNIKNNYWPGR